MRAYLCLSFALLQTLASIASAGLPHAGATPSGECGPVIAHETRVIEQGADSARYHALAYFAGIVGIAAVAAPLTRRRLRERRRVLSSGRTPAVDTDAPPMTKSAAPNVRTLLRELDRRQTPNDLRHQTWTQERLRDVLRGELNGNDIIVVSNREPYIHIRTPDGVRVQRPASGLVTALEPVMRACSGTWIAHGSGSADRTTVDRNDRISVPPERPLYRIRRVWLTPEEEAGYYSGFANEGLWPLCHIAHVRPTFRTSDWEYYKAVNAKFADAVVKEAQRPDPIVLVQDYHFALLPRMIRERLRNATVITFWHIPWPNPEAFAICPWRHQLLDGLLGSSILGFHTQFHCNNFLDTVDRLVEALVDRETFTVACHGRRTVVRRYPISIEWPPEPLAVTKSVADARVAVRERHGLPPRHAIGVGVDRLDYTKGIEERFRAVARLLEIHPRWVGRFTFIQIAAPSRGTIGDYRDYDERVRRLAAEINARYSSAKVPPILLLIEHHEPAAVYEYLRAAELCFVSSLHDGMNLVAKEFVAARDDDAGVLVLSQFAGASRELAEALIVNPYDADECAEALHLALKMPADEQRERMRLLREFVREFNVHRWAGRMLLDAAAMRQRNRFRRSAGAERV
jgi:trehalose 6-phosphate synthase